MRIILLSAVLVLAFNATTSEAVESASALETPKCPEESWFKGPYVPSEVVAADVFKAIKGIKPGKKSDDYQYKITAEDKGSYWEVVSHTLVRQANGKYDELAGAGSWMDIDKCKATILNAGTVR